MAKKLLDIVRDTIRMKHYSFRTEQVYIGWIKQYSKDWDNSKNILKY